MCAVVYITINVVKSENSTNVILPKSLLAPL